MDVYITVSPLNFEVIRVLAVLIGTGAAAWQDFKTSFIDDRIVLSMAALGLLLNFATLDASFVWSALWVPLLLAVVGYFMYRAGQLGGGDVLLFIGIALLLPQWPAGLQNWLAASVWGVGSFVSSALQLSARVGTVFPFFASVFVAASLFGLIGSSVQFAGLLLKTKKKLAPNLPLLAVSLLAFAALAAFVASSGAAPRGMLVMAVLLGIPAVFLTAFREQILRDVITVRVPVSKMLSEDVVATEVLPALLVKKYGIERVATEKQMALFRKLNKNGVLTRVPVYHHLPRFAPYVLAGLAFTLLCGDVLVLTLLL